MNCPQCSHSNSPLNFFCEHCDFELIEKGQMMTLHAAFREGSDDQQKETQAIDLQKTSEFGRTKYNSTDQLLTADQNLSVEQPFRIEKKLGEGAMGIVYQAKDLQLNRLIALKVFRSKKVSAAAREQMLDEARLASALNHPNIVTIYDVSRDNNHCYIAMEWIEGVTLEQILIEQENNSREKKSQTKITLLDKISCARQIAAGLSCAHQMDIVHRDLKPSNVMIRSQEPKVKILDFGVAEISKELTQQTEDDDTKLNSRIIGLDDSDALDTDQQETILDGNPNLSLCGTIGYMSPEQSLGKQLSHRSDLFSFGIILYQLFYGEHPFLKEKTEQTLASIRRQSPKFIRDEIDSSQTVPKLVQNIIQQCLEKKIDDRPESAAVVEQWLKNAETQEKSRIANKGLRYWVTSWRLGLVFALALVAGVSFNQYFLTTPVSREAILQQGKTIAVLPFSNPSSDPMLAVFANGLSVSLSNQLALVGEENEGAWVIPATEIGKQKDTSVQAIYKKYNPDLVLTGTIQHLGNIRRLSISLLNSSDSKLIQSSVHDIPVDRILESQKEIRNSVVELLNWKISGPLKEKMKKPLTNGSVAYQHYLQGLGYLYRYDYKNNLDAAIEEFRNALERDSNFLEATHEIAQTYVRAAKIRNSGDWIEQAQKYADIGMRLAPNNSYSHSILADVLSAKTQYTQALPMYEKAISLDVNNASAYFGLARIYKRNGQINKAEETYRQSLAIDDNWVTWNYLAVFYYRTNQFDKAEKTYGVLQKLTPNSEFAFQVSGAIQLGQGNYNSAVKTFTQAIKIHPSANNWSNLGTAQFYSRNYSESVNSFSEAVTKEPKNFLLWYNLGDAYRWSKAPSEAISAYQKSLELLEIKITKEPNKRQNKTFKAVLLAKMDFCELAVEEFEKIDSISDSYTMTLVAQMYAICKRPLPAIDWINKATQKNYPLQSIKDEPELSELFTTQFSKHIVTKKL